MSNRYLCIVLSVCACFQTTLASTFQTYDPTKRQVTLDEVPSRSLKIQQRVCVFQKKTMLGCGRVNELYANSATLIMDQEIEAPGKDSFVQLKAWVGLSSISSSKANPEKNTDPNANGKAGEERIPSSTEEVTSTFGTASVRDVSLTAGINTGLNYFYPSLHFQLAVSRSLSIGLSPMYGSYNKDDNDVTGYGGYLTLSYYHTHWVFRGLEVEGGVGLFNISAKNAAVEASTSAVAGKMTVGWRGRGLWDLGLDLGVAGGVQYFHHSEDVIDVSLKDVVPLLTAYIGYSF